MSLRLKIRLYNCLIKKIAIHASETWTLQEEDKRKLLVFEMRCLQAVLRVTRRDQLRNVEIRERLGISEHMVETIKERRLRWFGHVLRSPQESILWSAYSGDFTARRPVGRPPKRWKDQIAQDVGQRLRQCEAVARDREDWRELAGVRRRARGPYGLRP